MKNDSPSLGLDTGLRAGIELGPEPIDQYGSWLWRFPPSLRKESRSQPELILLLTMEDKIQQRLCAPTVIFFHSLILRTIRHRRFYCTEEISKGAEDALPLSFIAVLGCNRRAGIN